MPRTVREDGSGTEIAEKLTLSIPSPSSAPASLASCQRNHRSVPGNQERPELVAALPATLPAAWPPTLAAVRLTTGAVKSRAETAVKSGPPAALVQLAVVAVMLYANFRRLAVPLPPFRHCSPS